MNSGSCVNEQTPLDTLWMEVLEIAHSLKIRCLRGRTGLYFHKYDFAGIVFNDEINFSLSGIPVMTERVSMFAVSQLLRTLVLPKER
jgi:hypothetical protein